MHFGDRALLSRFSFVIVFVLLPRLPFASPDAAMDATDSSLVRELESPVPASAAATPVVGASRPGTPPRSAAADSVTSPMRPSELASSLLALPPPRAGTRASDSAGFRASATWAFWRFAAEPLRDLGAFSSSPWYDSMSCLKAPPSRRTSSSYAPRSTMAPSAMTTT